MKTKMTTKPGVYPYERRVEDLVRVYAAAQREVAALVREAILRGDLRTAGQRRLQLAVILARLDQLGAETDPVARELVRDAFDEGADRARQEILALSLDAPETPGAFIGVATDAVTTLGDSVVDRLRTARQTVGRSVDDVFAHAGRRAAVRAVLGQEGSPRKAARQLERDLRGQGEAGFVDKTGKRWGLRSYSEMAVRTITREAVVQGAITRMAAHGINVARWSVHGDACPVCSPWLGKLVSLDGSTGSLEGEEIHDLAGTPGVPAHPNCRCTLSPVSVRVERTRRKLQEA